MVRITKTTAALPHGSLFLQFAKDGLKTEVSVLSQKSSSPPLGFLALPGSFRRCRLPRRASVQELNFCDESFDLSPS